MSNASLRCCIVIFSSIMVCACGGDGTAASSAPPPAATASVSASVSSLIYGDILAGTGSSSQSVVISNTGAAALSISDVALSGTDATSFEYAYNCGATLSVGTSCSVSITFSPRTAGAKIASVSVQTSATSLTIALAGTGTAPVASASPSRLAFGSEMVGSSSASQSVTLSNSGTAELTISNIGLTDMDIASFSLTSGCSATLAVNMSCPITITFAPTTGGVKNANLTLQTSASSSPVIALSGTGSAPVVSLNPSGVNFGNAVLGVTPAVQSVTVANIGTGGLNISNVAISGTDAAAFSQSTTCASTLAPGSSCTVSLTFQPTVSGNKSASLSITSNAAAAPAITLSGTAVVAFPPYAAADPGVVLDIGVAALNPRNTWQSLPTGFALAEVSGATAGTVSDIDGFTPNSGGYIENNAAFPTLPSSEATIYMRLQRSALAADNSADSGTTFFDSSGNTTGGFGNDAAAAFTVFDGTNNILEWAMTAQPDSGPLMLDGGTWLYPGSRYPNSHSSLNLDPEYEDIVLTWQGTTYWIYLDGTPAGYGTFKTALPSAGQFSQVVIGGYLSGSGSVGHPLGPFSIQRFQISTAFSPPPTLNSEPLIGFYGDSFVVQGGGVTGDVPGLTGSPTLAQVNSVQAQQVQTTSPNATAGTIGQDGFISRAEAYALKQFGGYLQFYTAAQTGHGWAYTGMGGTTAANTPAIDDFTVGKTGYSDALNAAQPAYIFAFGSVNDVNNGVPADIVGDTRTHFDYWASNNPQLKGIYYIETLSWELATGACTSRGGPAGWTSEMARQRGLLRAAFAGGYLAGTRQVPVTYIQTYETWVKGPSSARFLIASNPDNLSESSNTGTSPNGHPDAEGNIQMVDGYVWPYLQQLIH